MLFGNPKPCSTRQKAYRKLGEGIMRLEDRALMAADLGLDLGGAGSIEPVDEPPAEESVEGGLTDDIATEKPTFRKPSRQVFIEGTGANFKDVVTVEYQDAEVLRITAEVYDLQGNLQSVHYFFTELSHTDSVVFDAFGGDDMFINRTSLTSYANGGDGNDSLYGGIGIDSFSGGAGNDILSGNAGDDSLKGDSGNDTIYGGAGDDYIAGDNSNWQIGHDYIFAGAGNDTIFGYGGNDTIYAGSGDDEVWAGYGNDLIFGDAGNDFLAGEAGHDAIYGDNPWTPNWLAGDDYISGGSGNDGLYGNGGNDRMFGGAGNDFMSGGAGNDYLDGGYGGFDQRWGGPGADTFVSHRSVFGLDDYDPVYDFDSDEGDRFESDWHW